MKAHKFNNWGILYNADRADVDTQVFDHNKIDAIITDPPYDLEFLDLTWLTKGNIIMFCKPENQYVVADEYSFWIKTPSTKNYSKKCGRFVEMILILRGENSIFNPLHWSQMTGVYDDRLVYKTIHPYQKPLSLMERLVRIYTNVGDTVYDPFTGSGTTALACKNLGRKFIGAEKNSEYFDIAVNRLK